MGAFLLTLIGFGNPTLNYCNEISDYLIGDSVLILSNEFTL